MKNIIFGKLVNKIEEREKAFGKSHFTMLRVDLILNMRSRSPKMNLHVNMTLAVEFRDESARYDICNRGHGRRQFRGRV